MGSSFVPGLGILGAIAIILGSVLMGFMIIGYGQLMLAIREIALNTRKEAGKNQYRILEIVASINNIIGWLVIIVGVIGGIFSAVSTLAPNLFS